MKDRFEITFANKKTIRRILRSGITAMLTVMMTVSLFAINASADTPSENDPILDAANKLLEYRTQIVQDTAAAYERLETAYADGIQYAEGVDPNNLLNPDFLNSLLTELTEADALLYEVSTSSINNWDHYDEAEILVYMWLMNNASDAIYELMDAVAFDPCRVTEVTEEPGPIDTPAYVEDPWKTIVLEDSAEGGYKIRETLTYSRIYQWDDPELASLWEEIGNGNMLPTPDDWGFTHYTDNTWDAEFGTDPYDAPGKFIHSRANTMYYMVGTIRYENMTEGWDLSNDHAVYVHPSIYVPYNGGCPDLIVGRIFYSNSTKTVDSLISFGANLTKNSTGPIPFIVGFLENELPDYPKGQYRTLYYTRDSGYLSFKGEWMDMEFWDETKPALSELPEETVKEPGILTLSDYPLSANWTKAQMRERFGEPDYEQDDYADYYDVSFLGYEGSLRFFYEYRDNDWRVNCISWTSAVCSRQLRNELLGKLEEYGSYKGAFSKNRDPQKLEEVVEINGTDYIIGLEDSANGQYLYIFSEFWNW